ncbi:DNA replication complex GINS protein SLD5 [Henckelia pumila]|uniref:DNA replication complex GINS protein SLD5 n=1 Tax=Henckelia pumila TaxID=405737 RepID=UPI003C6E5543
MESGAGERSLEDDYESLLSTTDAELLKQAWRNEKASPEILKFQDALIHRSRQQIQLMEETVGEFNKNGVDSLTVSLYQMDLDRTMFLLRSYLRTRLQKIEKSVFHIEKTTELLNRLSRQELEFAERFAEDLKDHLQNSVLLKLPSQYQSHLKQSSASEEDDMVPKPKLDTYVVCRSKKFLGAVLLDESGEDPVNIEADDLYALPYQSIKSLVESGQIDLV